MDKDAVILLSRQASAKFGAFNVHEWMRWNSAVVVFEMQRIWPRASSSLTLIMTYRVLLTDMPTLDSKLLLAIPSVPMADALQLHAWY